MPGSHHRIATMAVAGTVFLQSRLAAASNEAATDIVLNDPNLGPAVQRLSTLLVDFIALLPLLAVAALIVVVFTWLARRVRDWELPYRRVTRKPFLRGLLAQIAGIGVFLAGILMALELLDATTLVGAVLGAAGIVGIAVGFAFRDTAENYIAGLLLGIRQPFEPRDHVSIDGHEGYVMRLTPRATILFTLDGNHLRIPNARVFQSVMLNFSRNPKRRFDFSVGIAAEVEILAAQALAEQTLRDTAGVLADPAPWSAINELGDSNTVLRLYGWVDQNEANFGKVRSEAIRRIKESFDAANFEMPEPIYRLRIEDSAGALPATSRAPAPAPATGGPRATPEMTVDISPDREVEAQMARESAIHGADDDNLLHHDAELE